MDITKHPIVSVISLSAAFGSFVWIAAENLYIKPLERDKFELNSKIQNISSQVKSSNEYRELETVAIGYKAKLDLLEKEKESYFTLVEKSSSLEAENNRLNEFIVMYKDAIQKRDEQLIAYQQNGDILLEINKIKKEQDSAERELSSLHFTYEPKETELIRLNNRIKMLQEQINVLSKNIK